MDRICSWVRLLLRLTESLALVTAVMILVISNGTSEPLRLMIFIVFLRRSICVQFKRVPLAKEAPAKLSWDAFNWCDSMISLFSDMSMEKPLHFVFWRFRQNWAENLGAKFEAKALDKLCKESVCIPGRNIHGGVYFSGSLDRTIPYYIEKNDLWGRRSFHVKECVNCSWKTSQKVKDAKRNEKSEKRGCQTCRDMVLYLSAKGRRKEWLLKAAEAKRKNQYGYVEKRATSSKRSKSF